MSVYTESAERWENDVKQILERSPDITDIWAVRKADILNLQIDHAAFAYCWIKALSIFLFEEQVNNPIVHAIYSANVHILQDARYKL